jgi:hypothetical protein
MPILRRNLKLERNVKLLLKSVCGYVLICFFSRLSEAAECITARSSPCCLNKGPDIREVEN